MKTTILSLIFFLSIASHAQQQNAKIRPKFLLLTIMFWAASWVFVWDFHRLEMVRLRLKILFIKPFI